jgi:hypothetical protein
LDGWFIPEYVHLITGNISAIEFQFPEKDEELIFNENKSIKLTKNL